MIKEKKRWILVADGARARIFIKERRTFENALGQDFVADHLKNSEVGHDKPGRNFESGYSARHAYTPHTDWHQHQKSLFAKELCEILKKATENKEFDELIIISPPKTLGDLRENLYKQTLEKVVKEIPKDVTKFTEKELLSFLERDL